MIIVKKKTPIPASRWLNAKPGRIIALSFLGLIAVGTLLLLLPIASQDGRSVGFLRALFTATSAACVTGLVVVDTATHWTTFGKLVILALIQFGGLGLVTITTFFYSFIRKKTSLRTLVVTQESTANFSFIDVLRLVRRIVVITLVIELIGGILLSWRFIPRYGWSGGIARGFFQAVSAFCNAGFDLHGSPEAPYVSLTGFQEDPLVILITAVLIIFGGLGFVVWTDIIELPRDRRLNFHSKVVLAMTGLLIAIGTIFFLVAESSNTANALTIGSLPEWQRPLAAFFQSVATRTAGFNSIDQAAMTDGSKFFASILMFIGAAPGSTGGGIKVTTFAVILATIVSDFKGHENIVIIRHRLQRETFTRAFAIFGLALTLVMTTALILSFIERASIEAGRFQFIDLIFEAASAFGTVGLSAAGTASLQPASWALLIPVMFFGRVGPAAFAIILAMKNTEKRDLVHPDGKLMVG